MSKKTVSKTVTKKTAKKVTTKKTAPIKDAVTSFISESITHAEMFFYEAIVAQLQNEICGEMKKQKLTQKKLAKRMGIKKSKLKRFFGDSINKIRPFAKMLTALNCEIEIKVKKLPKKFIEAIKEARNELV